MASLKLYQFISTKEPLFHTLKSKKRAIPPFANFSLGLTWWLSHWNGDHCAYPLHFYTSVKHFSPTLAAPPSLTVHSTGCLSRKKPLPPELPNVLRVNPSRSSLYSAAGLTWVCASLHPAPSPSHSRVWRRLRFRHLCILHSSSMALLSVWLASFKAVSGSHQNWDSEGDEGSRSSLK